MMTAGDIIFNLISLIIHHMDIHQFALDNFVAICAGGCG
jgi:hypothetical protein